MTFNIADLFESVAREIPDKEALVCGDSRLTYGQLDRRANRLAHFMQARGVKAGQHIGLFLFNGVQYVEAMLAALKIRAAPINVNYRYVEDELYYLVNDADLVMIFYQQELAPLLHEVKTRAPRVETCVVVPDASGADTEAIGSVPYESTFDGQRDENDFGPRSDDDLYIIYTGGTTGMPKGVMWRHENIFFAGLQGGNPGGDPIRTPEELLPIVRSGDAAMTMMAAAPLIHGTAQLASWITFFGGGKVVMTPGRSFSAPLSVETIHKEQVQCLALVGDAMVLPFVDAVVRADRKAMSSLAVISSSGAILSDAVLARLESALPGTQILNNYGASETGHQGQAIPDDDGGDKKDKRIRFFMNERTVVVDDDLNPIEPGSDKVGRVAQKGHVPVGYYKDTEKTAKTFFQKDGIRWVVPGDMATIDGDGLITLLGRGSVCINTGGEKVYPEEVESALKAHGDILDAVVVGIADERWGQRVAAVVEMRDRAGFDPAAADRHCRTKIAGYKIPREWHVVEKISRHPSGKPDYRWAKAIAESGQYKR